MPTTNFDRLPNIEAITAFNGKALITSEDYLDLKAYEHALAFTVAKIADQDMLTEVHKAMKQALESGMTFHDFKKRLKPYLMAKGWLVPAFKNDNVDDDKEAFEAYNKHLGHRLKTIYHTNKQSAYAAGQWERIWQTKEFLPYLQYMPSLSERQRDEHRRYYHLVRPVDDPIWQSIFPPNGFGCKCWVKQLTRHQAQKIGITPDDDSKAHIEWVDYQNPKTGEVLQVPKGITPSFSHNHDRLTAMLKLAEEKHGSAFKESLEKEIKALLPKPKVQPKSKAKTKTKTKTNTQAQPKIDNTALVKQWLSDDKRLELYKYDYKQLNKKQFPIDEAEYIAIRYYTGNGYENLNKHLNGLIELDKEQQVMFNNVKALLNQALSKLPAYEGRVIRTLELSDEQLAKYQTGETIVFNAFTSATYGKKAVEIGGSKNVKLIITQKTGRKIDKLSNFAKEKEVLLGSPTKYRVGEMRYVAKQGYIEIELEQIIE